MSRTEFSQKCEQIVKNLISAYIAEDTELLQEYAEFLSEDFVFIPEYADSLPLDKSAFLNREGFSFFPLPNAESNTVTYMVKQPEDKFCIVFGYFPMLCISCVCCGSASRKIYISSLHASIPYSREWEEERRLDSLTGLFNRKYTELFIEKHLSARPSVSSCFMVDLDNFKTINDTLGHPQGDIILKKIAFLLTQCFDKQAVLGRMGGDEFLIYTESPAVYERPERFAKKIIASINTLMKAYSLEQSCSVGIVRANLPSLTFEQLYKAVDRTLYHAKNTGKANYCIAALL